jgi:hypothetical protein
VPFAEFVPVLVLEQVVAFVAELGVGVLIPDLRGVLPGEAGGFVCFGVVDDVCWFSAAHVARVTHSHDLDASTSSAQL